MSGRADRQSMTASAFPCRVTLMPPPSGFADAVEQGIIDFLSARRGAFDLFAGLSERGATVTYCFKRAEDASAFHARFAPGAVAAELRIPS